MEFSNEDLLRIFAPIVSFFVALTGTAYKFRKPLINLLLVLWKYIPVPNKEAKMDLSKQEKFLQILAGIHSAEIYIESTNVHKDKAKYILTIKLVEDIKILEESLNDYLIITSDMIRSLRIPMKSLIIDFSSTNFLNSKAQGQIVKFLGNFKEENGFDLIFICPQKNTLESFYRQLDVLFKDITGFRIEALKEDSVVI